MSRGSPRAMRRIGVVALLGLVAGPDSAVRVMGEETPATGRVYRVQPGDTPAGISRRFFGGEEFLPELLAFNGIADPNRIFDGMVLVIPGSVRDEALTAQAELEQALVRAADAAASAYAEEEFSAARELGQQSRILRTRGAYGKAATLAVRGLDLAVRALALADEKAPEQQPVTLTFADPGVFVSLDEGRTWEAAGTGREIQAGGLIRTEPSARAVLTMEDGSEIRLDQDTTMALRDLRVDRRDGSRISRLQVVVGGILGSVPPEEREVSEFQIDTGEGSVAIRGTMLRVHSRNNLTRLAVLEGAAWLSSDEGGVEVAARQGATLRAGRAPTRPEPLPRPPYDLVPRAVIHQTAVQTPLFRWIPLPEDRPDAYHLQVAKDPEFLRVVQDVRLEQTSVRSPVLPEGRYFWRVSCLDRKGLEGAFCPPRRLDVVKDFEVKVHPSELLVAWDGRHLAQPDVVYEVVPARADTSVVAVEYRINGGDFEVLTERFRLPRDGDYEIEVRGRCLEGQCGESDAFRVRVDGTAPRVTARVSPEREEPDLGSIVYLTLDAADQNGVARVEVTGNGSIFREYQRPIAYRADDHVRVGYRAHDSAGNICPLQWIELDGGTPRKN